MPSKKKLRKRIAHLERVATVLKAAELAERRRAENAEDRIRALKLLPALKGEWTRAKYTTVTGPDQTWTDASGKTWTCAGEANLVDGGVDDGHTCGETVGTDWPYGESPIARLMREAQDDTPGAGN